VGVIAMHALVSGGEGAREFYSFARDVGRSASWSGRDNQDCFLST
jgi:hypothetical protein